MWSGSWKRIGIVASLAGSGALTGCTPLPPTSWAPAVNLTMGTHPYSIDLADVTGDGLVDVVSGRMEGLALRPALVGGGYGDPQNLPFSGTYIPESIDVGDLDSDGLADVVVSTTTGVERFEWNGTTLVAGARILGNANATTIADVTGDGRNDLVVLAWYLDLLSVYPQQPDGSLGAGIPYPVDADGWNDLEVADLDTDGDNDVLVMAGQGSSPNMSVFLQGAGGALTFRGSYSVAGTHVLTHGIGVGYLDDDINAVVVVSHGGNGTSAKATLFQADGTGALTEGPTINVIDIPTPVEIADVNGDYYGDAVIGHSGWKKVTVLYGGPTGLAGAPQVLDAGDGSVKPDGLQVRDLDGDTKPDIGLISWLGGFTTLKNQGVPVP